jgi:hypothetical protein
MSGAQSANVALCALSARASGKAHMSRLDQCSLADGFRMRRPAINLNEHILIVTIIKLIPIEEF